MEVWFYIAVTLFPFALVGITAIYYEFVEISLKHGIGFLNTGITNTLNMDMPYQHSQQVFTPWL